MVIVSILLLPAQRYDNFNLVKFKKPAKLLSSSLPSHCLSVISGTRALALHFTIWCRSTFEPRGPGLSNPTSFLRPARPLAPTTDDNARDERIVFRPIPAKFITALYHDKLRHYMKKVHTLYYLFNSILHTVINIIDNTELWRANSFDAIYVFARVKSENCWCWRLQYLRNDNNYRDEGCTVL